MRTIKFRAWNHLAKRYEYDLYLNHEMKVVMPDGEAYDFILEQFTGLLDKNGKEIYEGDIYETTYGAEGVKARFVVRYNHGAFGLIRYGHNGQSPKKLGSRVNRSEGFVVGNIHEHGHLLQN